MQTLLDKSKEDSFFRDVVTFSESTLFLRSRIRGFWAVKPNEPRAAAPAGAAKTAPLTVLSPWSLSFSPRRVKVVKN